MQVTLSYMGQLRHLAEKESEDVEAADGATLVEVIREAATRYGSAFKTIVFDADTLRSSLMILIDDSPVDKSVSVILAEGQRIMLLSAISGG